LRSPWLEIELLKANQGHCIQGEEGSSAPVNRGGGGTPAMGTTTVVRSQGILEQDPAPPRKSSGGGGAKHLHQLIIACSSSLLPLGMVRVQAAHVCPVGMAESTWGVRGKGPLARAATSRGTGHLLGCSSSLLRPAPLPQ
jgi:hypothetical protein